MSDWKLVKTGYNPYTGRETSREIEIAEGDRVRTSEGWMVVETLEHRYCGEDDGRTGMPILDGRYEGQEYGEREGSWCYVDDVMDVKKATK